MRGKKPVISVWATIVILVFQTTISVLVACAGPPFITDDPEPLGSRHWEINVASQMSKDKNGISGTAPHFDINYGLLSNLDLHTIVPLAYVSPNEGSTNYGFGNIELGIKYRFIQESDWVPTVGTFPLVDLPTGSHKRGLGNGKTRVFIPLWLQKSWEPWTTYGGGGYWYNPGTDNKHYWFFGWLVQRDMSKKITLAAELFYTTPKAIGEGSEIGFNVGGYFNFTEEHHILFSAGRDIHGPNRFLMYIAYRLTLGPREEKEEGSLSWMGSNISYK
jgi:hypothetical protein